jgi:hypothetical protein
MVTFSPTNLFSVCLGFGGFSRSAGFPSSGTHSHTPL